MGAFTFGTGILICHSSEAKVPRVLVGLGASAANEAGLRMAAAVGYKFLRAAGSEGNRKWLAIQV
jgi:glycerate 2-kinase